MSFYVAKIASSCALIAGCAFLGRAFAASYRARPQSLRSWMSAFQGLLSAIMASDCTLEDALKLQRDEFAEVFNAMALTMSTCTQPLATVFIDAFGRSDVAQDWLNEDIEQAASYFSRLNRLSRGEISSLHEDFTARFGARVAQAQSERESSERLMGTLGTVGGIALALFTL